MAATTKSSWETSVSTAGAYVRKDSVFRDWVKADGSTEFIPEAGRYHLYVSWACPWAHRAIIVRHLKGLEGCISLDVVDWFLESPPGWRFNPEVPGCTPDTVNGKKTLREMYEMASDAAYDGRVTVPVLWDKKTKTIVNNESSEILRMLNSEFNEFCATEEQRKLDLCPAALQPQIDEVNSWVYRLINNGVYRAGFARTQEAYDAGAKDVFSGLDKVEAILAKSRYIVGEQLSEADVRLYTSLVRFDAVYHGHFKCNRKRIVDYPNLWGYLRDLYQRPGFGETTNLEHIVKHYVVSHKTINPFGIVPLGPELDFLSPHGRDKLQH